MKFYMKASLLALLFASFQSAFAQDGLIEITEEEIGEYWLVDQDRMSEFAPLEMIQLSQIQKERKGGTWYQYEFVIDSDGIPKEFIFFAAQTTEKGINVADDEKLLKRHVLFHRYKPVDNNKELQRVKVKINTRFWDPNNIDTSKNAIIEVTNVRGLDRYWLVDSTKTELLKKIQESKNWYQFEYVVDSDGVPKEFVFFGAQPSVDKSDEKLLQEYILQQRFKPTEHNKNLGLRTVKVKNNMRF